MPDELVRTLYDIMPSAGLIRHQWRRHGSCAGLAMDDYFAVLRAAREKVAVPAEFRRLDASADCRSRNASKQAFLEANQDLPPGRHRGRLRQALSRGGPHLPDQGSGFPACARGLERRSCRACDDAHAARCAAREFSSDDRGTDTCQSCSIRRLRPTAPRCAWSLPMPALRLNAVVGRHQCRAAESSGGQSAGQDPDAGDRRRRAIFDSRAITQYLNRLSGGKLFPRNAAKRTGSRAARGAGRRHLRLPAGDVYERRFRPEEMVHQPWLDQQWARWRAASIC